MQKASEIPFLIIISNKALIMSKMGTFSYDESTHFLVSFVLFFAKWRGSSSVISENHLNLDTYFPLA